MKAITFSITELLNGHFVLSISNPDDINRFEDRSRFGFATRQAAIEFAVRKLRESFKAVSKKVAKEKK